MPAGIMFRAVLFKHVNTVVKCTNCAKHALKWEINYYPLLLHFLLFTLMMAMQGNTLNIKFNLCCVSTANYCANANYCVPVAFCVCGNGSIPTKPTKSEKVSNKDGS